MLDLAAATREQLVAEILQLRAQGAERIALQTEVADLHRQLADAQRLHKQHIRPIVDDLYQFVGLLDTDGIVLDANAAALSVAGVSREMIIGQPFQDTPWWASSPEQQRLLQDAIARAAQGAFVRFEAEHFRGDARRAPIHVDFSLTPVRDHAGDVRFLIPEGRNITDRKRAEAVIMQQNAMLRRLYDQLQALDDLNARFLADARRVLAASLDATSLLHAIVRLPIPTLCDSCIIDLVGTDQDQPHVVVAHVDQSREELIHELHQSYLAHGGQAAIQTVLHSGQPCLISPTSDSERCATLEQKELSEHLDAVGKPRSAMIAPLVARGRAIGTISLIASQRKQPYGAADLALVEELAQLAALAIDNARLYDNERHARLAHARLLETIRDGHTRLQTLSRRLIAVQEDERRHLARELHDEIGQALTGISLLLLAIDSRAIPDDIRARLAEARMRVNELTAQVRHLSLDLRPAMLDDLGLLPALMWYIKRYTEQTHLHVDFQHAGLDRRFAPDVEITAYRVAQEALTNVARHAGVVTACIAITAVADRVEITVTDYGRGFDPLAQPAQESGGLLGMRERVQLLGGALTITSAPGAGTRVVATVPIAAAQP